MRGLTDRTVVHVLYSTLHCSLAAAGRLAAMLCSSFVSVWCKCLCKRLCVGSILIPPQGKIVSSPFSPYSKTYIKCGGYTPKVKWPEQPIRQHLRLSFDELFTAMWRTLFNSDSLESYGSERLSYLLGWPSLYLRIATWSSVDGNIRYTIQQFDLFILPLNQ